MISALFVLIFVAGCYPGVAELPESETDSAVDTGDIGADSNDTDDSGEPADTEETCGCDTEDSGDSGDSGDTNDSGDTGVEDEWSSYVYVAGNTLYLSVDGMEETPYTTSAAYAVGYGSGLSFDNALDSADLVLPNSGYFVLDFGNREEGCYELTLVSAVEYDGDSVYELDEVEQWWQNYEFCTSGSATAIAYCARQGGWDTDGDGLTDWYEYLLRVCLNDGLLAPAGDGVAYDM